MPKIENIEVELLQAMTDMRKFGLAVYIDFEFNNSQEKEINLVSCSLSYLDTTNPAIHEIRYIDFWLKDNIEEKENLKNWIHYFQSQGYRFVAYAASAEARSIQSLGIDPMSLKWIDLYAEWRQLTYNNHSCEYGTIFNHGFRQYSTPPSFDSSKNTGCHKKVEFSMAASVAQMFAINIDTRHKDQMRDLILMNKNIYTDQEKHDIMSYCQSDIKYLPLMWKEMTHRLAKGIQKKWEVVIQIQERRGRFISAVAKMETRGYPVIRNQIEALRHNFEMAQDTIISELVTNHWPFFRKQKKNASDIHGKWTDKYDEFVRLLDERYPELKETWPRTIDKKTKKETDKLSREEKILNKYPHVPEVVAYKTARKMITQLAWFKEPDEKKLAKSGDFFDSVGSDDRLRTFLGAFGTQTARNAPKASRFILAMSSWLRCVIQPRPGKVIIGIDYASQEFAIAAILSGDQQMMAAYRSGDPYLFFAKEAGGVRKDADPKKVKNPFKVLEEGLPGMDMDFYHMDDETKEWIMTKKPQLWREFKEYEKHENSRQLFKSCLGGDTLIRVKGKGFVPITKIKKEDLIWDGEDYITHDGVVFKGIKKTTNLEGLEITPDHKILTHRGWEEVGTVKKARKERKISKEDIRRFQQPRASWSDVWSLVCSLFRDNNKKRI